jgi:hypothetical protein
VARPRVPKAKADVAGSAIINPGRFAARTGPKRTRPIGEPYATMTDPQQRAWEEYRNELPWLNSSHRPLLRLACIWTARMEQGDEFGVSATQALSSILSKLGATPVDETKVNHGDGEEEDPADEFFGRPH